MSVWVMYDNNIQPIGGTAIPLASAPSLILVDGTTQYAFCSGSLVKVVDGSISETINPGLMSTAYSMCFDDKKSIWLGDMYGALVEVKNDAAGTKVEGLVAPYGVCFTGKAFWVVSIAQPTAYKIVDGKIDKTLTLTQPAFAAYYNKKTDLVYIVSPYGFVQTIDANDNIGPTYTVGTTPNAIDGDSKGNIYVANSAGTTVSKIAGGNVTNIDVGGAPNGLCIDQDILYVAVGKTVVKIVNDSIVDTYTFSGTTSLMGDASGNKTPADPFIYFDVVRKVQAKCESRADTKRIVSMQQSIRADSSRKVQASCLSNADVCRKITAALPVFQSLTLDIATKTLSDKFTVVTPTAIEKKHRFAGKIKDFPFVFIADDRSLDKQMLTVTGIYDIDDLLSKYVFFGGITQGTIISGSTSGAGSGGTTSGGSVIIDYFSDAKSIMVFASKALGKNFSFNFDDFAVKNFADSKKTMRDVISGLFSWTDKIPNRLVNVYLRDNTLYVVQRGKEAGSASIEKYANPVISKKTLRLLNNAIDTDGNAMQDDLKGDEPSDKDGLYRSGTVTLGDTEITYSNGLVVREQHIVNGVISVTTYDYNGSPPNALRSRQTTVSSNGQIVIDYIPDSDGNLIREDEVHYDSSGNVQKKRETRHFPLGLDDWGTEIVEDGAVIDRSISQGPPSAKATPYQLKKAKLTTTTTYTGAYYVTLSGPLKDYLGDIPVTDLPTLQAIAKAITWLNGKTEERIRLDVFDDHIFEPSKTVIWNGNVYFLENNSITMSAREYRQQIELVRWYDE